MPRYEAVTVSSPLVSWLTIEIPPRPLLTERSLVPPGRPFGGARVCASDHEVLGWPFMSVGVVASASAPITFNLRTLRSSALIADLSVLIWTAAGDSWKCLAEKLGLVKFAATR
jgi:hypothetical protein